MSAGAMLVTEVRKRGVPLPPVGQDDGAGGDGAPHEPRERSRQRIRDDVEPHPAGGPPPNFYGAHDPPAWRP